MKSIKMVWPCITEVNKYANQERSYCNRVIIDKNSGLKVGIRELGWTRLKLDLKMLN